MDSEKEKREIENILSLKKYFELNGCTPEEFTKDMNEEVNSLRIWFMARVNSIRIGSLSDEVVRLYREYDVDFGIKPLLWQEWLWMLKDYLSENPASYVSEGLVIGKYKIGKWVHRQRRNHNSITISQYRELEKCGVFKEEKIERPMKLAKVVEYNPQRKAKPAPKNSAGPKHAIEYGGVRYESIKAFAEAYDLPYQQTVNSLRYGYSMEEIVNRSHIDPRHKQFKYNGKSYKSLIQFTEEFSLPYASVYKCVQEGMNIEEIAEKFGVNTFANNTKEVENMERTFADCRFKLKLPVVNVSKQGLDVLIAIEAKNNLNNKLGNIFVLGGYVIDSFETKYEIKAKDIAKNTFDLEQKSMIFELPFHFERIYFNRHNGIGINFVLSLLDVEEKKNILVYYQIKTDVNKSLIGVEIKDYEEELPEQFKKVKAIPQPQNQSLEDDFVDDDDDDILDGDFFEELISGKKRKPVVIENVPEKDNKELTVEFEPDTTSWMSSSYNNAPCVAFPFKVRNTTNETILIKDVKYGFITSKGKQATTNMYLTSIGAMSTEYVIPQNNFFAGGPSIKLADIDNEKENLVFYIRFKDVTNKKYISIRYKFNGVLWEKEDIVVLPGYEVYYEPELKVYLESKIKFESEARGIIGIKIDKLSFDVQGSDLHSRINLLGEITKETETRMITESFMLKVVLYDSDGKLMRQFQDRISTKRFSTFDVFNISLSGEDNSYWYRVGEVKVYMTL